jgi:hypothetical protein
MQLLTIWLLCPMRKRTDPKRLNYSNPLRLKGEKRAQFALGTWYISLRSLYFVPWCEPSVHRVTESQFFNVRPTMTREYEIMLME